MSAPVPFGDRLLAACEAKESVVVAGIDPRLDEMPACIKAAAVSAHGPTPAAVGAALRTFQRELIGAVAPHVVAVKVQAAFYEQYGAIGIAALEDALACAREHDLLTIVDGKRNDIGSTAEAYAAAYLGEVSGLAGEAPGPLRADALTVNPYPGDEGMRPFIQRCVRYGSGIFVLVRTSNPGSALIQEAPVRGEPLYRHLAEAVARWGEGTGGASGYRAVGAVVGATQPAACAVLRRVLPHSWFLLPGYGTQGAGWEDVVGAFNGDGWGALISASRTLARAYRTPPWDGRGEAGFAWAAAQAAEAMRLSLAKAARAARKGS